MSEEKEYIRLMVDKIMTRGEEVGIEDAIAEAVALLNATITGQASALREQTTKVQERDTEIEMLNARINWLLAQRDETEAVMMPQIHLRDKEIERLRAALDEAYVDVGDIYGAKPSEVEELVVAARAKISEVLALKGAE